jgi:hypothetical protein
MSTPTNTVRDTRTLHLVSALVDEGLIASTRRDDAIGVVDRVLGGQSTQTGPLKRRLAELAGYVGGAFVISAAAIFLTAQWDSLASGQRVLLLAGVALLLAVAGGAIGAATGAGFSAVRSGREPVRRRLTGALLTGAAASAAGAVGVLFDWQYPDTDTGAALTGFAVLTVLSLIGYLVAPTVVGQLGVAAGAVTSVALVVEQSDGAGIAMGLGTIGLGLVWIVAAERGLWREIASARVIGCVLAVVGAQIPVWDLDDHRWVGYLALALVAAAAFATYVARPAWPYLAAGVIAVTLVIPEALIDWTDNALGPAGALLVAGLTLLAASLVGLRLRKELTEKPAG